MSDFDDKVDQHFHNRMMAARPEIVALIEKVTGWREVDDLASWVIRLLEENVYGSPMKGIRLPCWQDHAPQTVVEYTRMLVEVTQLPEGDPFIQQSITEYRNKLRERFGLD